MIMIDMGKIQKIKIISTMLILTALSAAIPAFSAGGSHYSIFGIGDVFKNTSAVYEGRGGTSIAMPSGHAVNLRNPALWSTVENTRLQVGYRFDQHIAEGQKESLFQNNGNVNEIYGLFAIDTSMGIALSFGLHPYSNVNYLIGNSFAVELDELTQQGKSTYQGKGGISSTYIGASFQIYDKLSVGASIFATFGYIGTMSLTEIYDANTYISTNIREDHFRGSGFRLGMYYPVTDDLAFGAFYEKVNDNDITSDITFRSELIPDSAFSLKTSTPMPSSYGFGVSYKTGKFIIGADASFSDYSKITYHSGPATEFKQATNFSLGISRLGNRALGSEFIDKITYNFGLGYNDLYYRIDGTDINEIFGSFGTEIPIVGSAKLDLSLVMGYRGTLDKGLIRDYFARFNFNLSMGETWFVPFKREFE